MLYSNKVIGKIVLSVVTWKMNKLLSKYLDMPELSKFWKSASCSYLSMIGQYDKKKKRAKNKTDQFIDKIEKELGEARISWVGKHNCFSSPVSQPAKHSPNTM